MDKRIGIFPRDRDSFMTTNFPEGVKLVYLVINGSSEDNWCEKFLKNDQVVKYEITKESYYVTELSLFDILQNSNIAEILKNNNIQYLYVDIATEFIERWGLENDINIIVTPFKFRKIYENKIQFDKLLEKNAISKPESSVIKLEKENNALPFEGKVVLQKAVSSGGEGTYFINKYKDIEELIEKKELQFGDEYLVRKFIKGTTYGITVFVSPGTVALSSIRLQCFDKDIYPNKNIFIGLQWIPADSMSDKLKNNINIVFSKLGSVLYREEFHGFANFDFQVDEDDDVYLIECNARFSAATVHYLRFKDLLGGVDASNIFLANMIFEKPFPTKFEIYPFPNTNFSGSLLKINIYPDLLGQNIEIQNEFDIGVYNYEDNKFVFDDPDIRNIGNDKQQFLFCTDVKVGERYKTFSEIYRIFSNYQLFDFSANLNIEGKKLKDYFRCNNDY